MGSDQGSREAGLGSDLLSGMVDLVVQAAKMRHEMNLGVDALRAWRESRGVDGDPGRVANLGFDLAELGVRGWRDLMQLQRRYEPEMLAAWTTPGLPWMDPTAELYADQAIVTWEAKRKSGNGTELGTSAAFSLTLENRSQGYVDLVFPRTLAFLRADDDDRLVVEVSCSPAAPILGPGDRLTLELTLKTDGAIVASVNGSSDPVVYLGTLCLRTRGALRVDLPARLTVTA